jgi:DNA-binding MarR family transcriptional regulator
VTTAAPVAADAEEPRLTTANLGFLLSKASQRWNELLVERFAARGYSEVRPSYGSVLMPLFERDRLRLGEIAARAHLSKQSMTALVRQCEDDGLVRRRRDPADGRAFRVELTPRGREFRGVVDEILGELDAAVLAALGRRQRDALVRALKGVMEL